ncbi:MAG: bile acid:sodium symporter family protein [Paludibacteraceae bacterium]|nr:bile acid:sodium symporter family protein [Paludibacteraceae bacterium]
MKTLQAISSFLSRKTSLFIIAIAILTFFFRDLFVWVRNDTQTVILGFIMLTMGMTLTTNDFKILASRPVDILIGTIAQFSVMPLIAYTLVHVLNLPVAIGTGLLLVGCCPGGVSSNIMSFLCKGDVAFSVGMTSVNTLLAPIVTPLLMLWLTGENVDVDGFGMFKSILIVTLIPVAVGVFINHYFGQKKGFEETKKIMPGLSVICLACIVGGVVSQHGDSFLKSGLLIFFAIFCHNTLGYILGYTLGTIMRFNDAKRKTISIEVGMQNAGLATNLASKHFPAFPEVAIVSAICCVWHSITGTILANLFIIINKKKENND